MPKGCFVILIPTDADYKVLGYYFKEKKSKFEVTNDLFLRLNLDHSKNKKNLLSLLKLKNHAIVSYYHEFKGKLLSRKASGIIIGLLLNDNDKPEKFQTALKEACEAIENLNVLEISKQEFESNLEKIYLDIEPLTDILAASALKESIINRTKEMLSGGKKERKNAQILLQKIEDNEHAKISKFYQSAEKAKKVLDHDKAEKMFRKAAELAEELFENDLARLLKEKSLLSAKIPQLTKTRDKFIQDARNALKNEDFHSAYISYRKAGELSKQLMQFDKEEEYRLKAKALDEFYQVDIRFKKKK